MDITNVLSNYFMTVDMHRFALMWLVYSGNKFFRVGPNISEKFVPGGTNSRGVQIKRDRPTMMKSSKTHIGAPRMGRHEGMHSEGARVLDWLVKPCLQSGAPRPHIPVQND